MQELTIETTAFDRLWRGSNKMIGHSKDLTAGQRCTLKDAGSTRVMDVVVVGVYKSAAAIAVLEMGKTDSLKRFINLYTSGRQHVATVATPPFKTPPDVIVWGDRFFKLDQSKYIECFAYVIPEVDHADAS